MKCITKLSLLGALSAASVLALDNGLGRVPAMGYNSWYDWTCNMDEKQLRDTVDAMVSEGFVELGYTYFNLDDCWSKGRYANGSQYADPAHFPSATLKPLADYAHSKGMLFGTYTDRGTQTCGGRPGAEGYEQIDADTYASWDVDYLKEDSCHAPNDPKDGFAMYGKMRDALNKTGRPIYFSLCGWESWYAPQGQQLGNSWRIGPDDTNWHGVLTNIDINANLAAYAGPGGWNDPCLLLAEEWSGTQRQTELQTRAQFNMWAVMASPLLISANVRNMSAMNKATYKNAAVIAVNQDPLGKQGVRLVGGNLVDTHVSHADNIPAKLAPCNNKDKSQNWDVNTPASGYFKNTATGVCLNVDDCGSDVIYFECVTSGGTCCGSDCYKNMQFDVDNVTGHMTSPMHPGQCITALGATISFVSCDTLPAGSKWTYTPNGALMFVASAGAPEMCLSASTTPPATGATNVWGRVLSTKAWALVFLNTGAAAADITCDAECFAQMNITAGTKLAVKDLWSGATSTISAGNYTVPAVAAEGGSVMVTLTPVTV
eukprot:m.375207 g.375207  ORF g.375207 m.375207 type:complete len:544 (+) comp20915_c0_seq2:152-1783(+)